MMKLWDILDILDVEWCYKFEYDQRFQRSANQQILPKYISLSGDWWVIHQENRIQYSLGFLFRVFIFFLLFKIDQFSQEYFIGVGMNSSMSPNILEWCSCMGPLVMKLNQNKSTFVIKSYVLRLALLMRFSVKITIN